MTTRVLWLLLLPVLWLGLLAGVMIATDAAPAAVVVLPSEKFLDALPDGIAVVSQTPVTVTLAGPPGLTKTLYATGAWLVLPAGLAGCSPE